MRKTTKEKAILFAQISHAEKKANFYSDFPPEKGIVFSVINMLERMIDETSGGFVPCPLTMEQARMVLEEAKLSKSPR